MSENDALLAAVMELPPKKRDELWDELVELGIIEEEAQT